METNEEVESKDINLKEAEIASRFLNVDPSNPKVNFWLSRRTHRSGNRYQDGEANQSKKRNTRMSI